MSMLAAVGAEGGVPGVGAGGTREARNGCKSRRGEEHVTAAREGAGGGAWVGRGRTNWRLMI